METLKNINKNKLENNYRKTGNTSSQQLQSSYYLAATGGKEVNMARNTELNIDINVTKIVKYTCLAGIAIVAVIFIEKAFKEFVKSPYCTKKCTD